MDEETQELSRRLKKQKRNKKGERSPARKRQKRSHYRRERSSSSSPPSRRSSRSPSRETHSRARSPPSRPASSARSLPSEDDVIETVDNELLEALGEEGKEVSLDGEPIHPQLAKRWTKLMAEGLGKEAKELIIKKYPIPQNFTATAPQTNMEIAATFSEAALKRDKRFISRQNLTGTLMSIIGKSMTKIMKGNINSKQLIEEMSDAAKIAAEMFHIDSGSRKFFALSGASKTVQDALKQTVTDEFLFGKDCNEKIKTAQALQRNVTQYKQQSKQHKKGNWRSPLPAQQRPRGSGGPYKYVPRQRASPRRSAPKKPQQRRQPTYNSYKQQQRH